MIDSTKFFDGYKSQFGTLNQTQVDGLNSLISCFNNDAYMSADNSYMAYALATIKWECADKFQPIAEIGHGRGHPYGVPDQTTGQTYYGRGYVQLTWKVNYDKFSSLLGVDLTNNPDLALDPKIAYQILTEGMTRGLFTGKKLADYITDTTVDYYSCRKIINGLDHASTISDFADKFETILNGAT